MSRTVRLVGMAHSKLRNAIGLVGIEADPVKQEVQVRFVKHWERNELNQIPVDVAEFYEKFQWTNTIIDLQVGEHVIQGLRRIANLPIRVIFIKKKVVDPSEIRRVKTLALIEMVQYMLELKLAHKIKFPKNPTETMQMLESQFALYSEHTTEAGGIDYYSPGDELDNLTKALITVTFAARPFIHDSVRVVCGPVKQKSAASIEDLSYEINKPRKRKRIIKGI